MEDKEVKLREKLREKSREKSREKPKDKELNFIRVHVKRKIFSVSSINQLTVKNLRVFSNTIDIKNDFLDIIKILSSFGDDQYYFIFALATLFFFYIFRL